MRKVGEITIETGIPRLETRGRKVSDEYVALIEARVGQSFTSHKSRDTLYQIARNLGIKVNITSAGKDGWRVFKARKRVLWKRKSLIPNGLKAYSANHGREKALDPVSHSKTWKSKEGSTRQSR